jgi:hypothetical protein
VSLLIKAGDRVWVGYNAENTSKRLNICGMNTKAGSSYFWSYLKTFNNLVSDYQINGPYYVESTINSKSSVINIQNEIDSLETQIVSIYSQLDNISCNIRNKLDKNTRSKFK